MHVLVFSLLLGMALLLESTLLQFVRVAGVRPDLVLVLVVFHAMVNGSRDGAFWGFMGGLAQDFLSGYYLGMNALSLAVVGYLVGLGYTRLFRESHYVLAGVAFLATVAGESFRYLLILGLGITVLPGEALWGLVLPVGVYNAAVALLCYRRFYMSATRGVLRTS